MFYKKKLGSIAELQAERLALKKYAKKKLETLDAVKENKSGDEYLAKRITSLTKGLLGNSKYAEIINTVTQIALPFLLKKVAAKSARNLLTKAATEMVGGYAKWKAISLVTHLVITQFKKKIKKEAE
jgi:hypothetical protein